MGEILKLKIQLRRDTSENWLKYNPVLLDGEAAVSSDLNQIKFGDGTSRWSELDYVTGSSLAGFAQAEAGAYPVKQEDGSLKWMKPSASTVEGLTSLVEQQGKDLANLKALTESTQIKISIHDVVLSAKEEGRIDIPLATAINYGVVRGSEEENKISILEDGTMLVNSLNVNKLTQTNGEELILNANY